MKRIYFLFFLCLFFQSMAAQSLRDSILVNERKIDRPLTLHKGQLQISPAYQLSVITNKFDAGGSKIDLTKEAISSVMHKYLLEINYGLFDFLTLTLATFYGKQGERGETEKLIISLDEAYLINSLSEYKGFDDMYLGTNIKIPLKTRKFEFSLSSGVFLPWTSNEPLQPEHTIELQTIENPYSIINYQYKYKICRGVPVLKLGASTIIRPGNNLSLFAQFNYSAPLAEGENVAWIHQLVNDGFEYLKLPYKFLLGNVYDYKIGIGYQAISWFNVGVLYNGIGSSSGWNELTGVRMANASQNLSAVSLEYEIKITGKLWMRQWVDIPFAGKNKFAPVSILTGITYNFLSNGKNNQIITTEPL